jgi:hypothetical protein
LHPVALEVGIPDRENGTAINKKYTPKTSATAGASATTRIEVVDKRLLTHLTECDILASVKALVTRDQKARHQLAVDVARDIAGQSNRARPFRMGAASCKNSRSDQSCRRDTYGHKRNSTRKAADGTACCMLAEFNNPISDLNDAIVHFYLPRQLPCVAVKVF